VSLIPEDIIDDVEILEGSQYTVKRGKPAKVYPKTIWMYFPLEKAEMEKMRDDLNGRASKGPMSRNQLLAEIRKAVEKSGKDAFLPASGAPQWYEVPASEDGKSFTRVFTIDQTKTEGKPLSGAAYSLELYEHLKGEDIIEIAGRRVNSREHAKWVRARESKKAGAGAKPEKTP